MINSIDNSIVSNQGDAIDTNLSTTHNTTQALRDGSVIIESNQSINTAVTPEQRGRFMNLLSRRGIVNLGPPASLKQVSALRLRNEELQILY